jgi:hypothetical protein
MKISRRNFLLLGSGTLVLSGIGLTYSSKENFLQERLYKMLGDFDISDSDFKRFNEHFRSFISENRYDRYHTMIQLEKFTFNGNIDPLKINERIDKWDRRLVTQFITSTDYLERQGEKVRFIGAYLPCRNPFADYSFA